MSAKTSVWPNNFTTMSRERLLSSPNSESCTVDRGQRACCRSLSDGFAQKLNDLQVFAKRAIEMGRSDPRKIIFAIKSGVAMALVSLLIFWKYPLDDDVSRRSIWAMLTVIVTFEFSIGATFIKGFNRGLGTFCAGILAYGFVALIKLTGHWENVIFVISLSLTAFFASYLKLYPSMAPYEYGFRVFVLTYCILTVAGQRTGEYSEAILTRLALIALGGSISFIVSVSICPIWAGEDLHRLVVKNFRDLAASLEGCVNEYLAFLEYKRISSMILTYQDSEDPVYNSYRAVVESKTREQTLLNFALWEPAHGRYKMPNYPWRNYVKVSGALRHCAFMVMALHGCVLSEIQAPPENRQVFRDKLQKVGTEGAKVLNEIGSKIEKMEKLGSEKILKEAHEAAEQLQKQIDQKLHLLVNPESWESQRQTENQLTNSESFSDAQVGENTIQSSLSEAVIDLRPLRKQVPWPSSVLLEDDLIVTEDEIKTNVSATALSLATFASLLVEFVARLQNVVDTFEELSHKANFRDPVVESSDATKTPGFWNRLLRCLSPNK